MREPYIFNIQRFSIHDGPGIRTTVFFKGCPLSCKWCHNPESQSFEQEYFCVRQQAELPDIASGVGCDSREFIGTVYAINELMALLKKDILFYDQSGGGVTLSGGEVMAQDMDYLLALLQGLKNEGISVTIDTCGYASRENFARVLPYVDLFLYDLKLMDAKKHAQYTGVSNELILQNLKFLSDQGANIELRLPLVADVNMGQEDMDALLEWLQAEKICLTGITLLPYHEFGRDKYEKLGRACTQKFQKPTEEDVHLLRRTLEKAGFQTSLHE